MAGAATSVPAFTRLNTTVRSKLVEAVAREPNPLLQGRSEGSGLTFSMSMPIAITF